MSEEKTTRHKSDSSEMEKRINTIYLMLLQGYERKQIIQYCTENYNISERQTDEYLKKAREMFKQNACDDLDGKKFHILSQFNDLYQKNYKLEEYKECRNILKDISSVLGIDAPKKVDHTTNGESLNLSPEDRKRRIAELKSKME